MFALSYALVSYSIRGLTFAYSRAVPVVENLDLNIAASEFVSIVGPNGAGKSTLLKLMAGLLDACGGEIAFKGKPIGSRSRADLARQMAFVPQETHVVFPFTSAEIVRMGRLPFRTGFFFDTPEDGRHVAEAMERTETVGLADKVFADISGGERQRVVLASALAQSPEVLLLDEPTVYLDLRHQLEFYRILTDLHDREGTTIVAVTHDINLAARHAERMIVIAEGRVAADGTPAQVLTPDTLFRVFGIHASVVEGPDGDVLVIPRH